jgi:hypothetical protein
LDTVRGQGQKGFDGQSPRWYFPTFAQIMRHLIANSREYARFDVITLLDRKIVRSGLPWIEPDTDPERLRVTIEADDPLANWRWWEDSEKHEDVEDDECLERKVRFRHLLYPNGQLTPMTIEIIRGRYKEYRGWYGSFGGTVIETGLAKELGLNYYPNGLVVND